LTPYGIGYAEQILFLRRNNYQRIVYESRHMCMTAMFEKAVHAAASANSEFGQRCHALRDVRLDWTDRASVDRWLPSIWRLYGLVDYEALDLLEETNTFSVGELVRRIRTGSGYTSQVRLPWARLHYLAKQLVFSLKTESDAFRLRRKIEVVLARPFRDVDPILIACHLPRFVTPGPLRIGTTTGALLEDVSALGRFLTDDTRYQYTVELFVDHEVSEGRRDAIVHAFRQMMEHGQLGDLENAS
jgi:hypothetical protein